jgi:hypothetical protein
LPARRRASSSPGIPIPPQVSKSKKGCLGTFPC